MGGRKTIEEKHPKFADQLEHLLEPYTRGDPEFPLRWTCKSTLAVAKELGKQQIPVCHEKVAQSLRSDGFSLQGNRKTEEGSSPHPDRNAQFEYINATAREALRREDPVTSVDTQKKEWVGNYANKGRQWLKIG